MRVLMDDHKLGWTKAWDICSKVGCISRDDLYSKKGVCEGEGTCRGQGATTSWAGPKAWEICSKVSITQAVICASGLDLQ